MSEVALRQLRERCDELEEENRQLRETLAPHTVFPWEWKLRPAEERVLSCFLSSPNRIRTKEQLRQAISKFADTDGKVVEVTICQLRKKVQPFGIEILTRWSVGYEITPETHNLLKDAQQ